MPGSERRPAEGDLPPAGLPDGNEVAFAAGSVGLREHHQAAVAGPRHAGELEMDRSGHVGNMPEVTGRRVEQPDVGDLDAGERVGGIGEVERDQSAVRPDDGLIRETDPARPRQPPARAVAQIGQR
ncbi:MAG TPA: hypothetical protein VIV12_08020 [Streptosporangiaceae bacterium]